MKTIKNYVFFWDGWLSNFYHCKIVFNNKVFCSSEQLFMYLKALYFKDYEIASQILKVKTPKEAKKLGRKIRDFNEEAWSEVREDKMEQTIKAKFNQNPQLKELLLSEEFDNKQFVEASPYDRIWGIGYSEDFAMANINDWGQNLLGKIITQYRENHK